MEYFVPILCQYGLHRTFAYKKGGMAGIIIFGSNEVACYFIFSRSCGGLIF